MAKRNKNKGNSPAPALVAENNDNVEAVVVIDTAETVDPVVDADVLAALASAELADAELITAEDVDPPTDEEVLAEITTATKPARKAKSTEPKAPPAIIRAFTAVAQIDQATLDANLAGCNAKKVREKVENLIASVQSGKRLSNFTKVAALELAEHGRISGKSMTEAFSAKGLSIGTARAQGQQMTALFKIVGAVTPEAGSRDLVIADQDLVNELALLAA